MIGKNVENKDYKDNKKEKRIIDKMIEGIRNQNLCAKDWEEFYKKVIINPKKRELSSSEKSKLKMLLIFEMPSEYRKQVININK